MTVASVLGSSVRRLSHFTAGGAPIPAGWSLVRLDTFGTSGSVGNFTQLHALYNEGQYYNSDFQGNIVSNPINSQQQTYQHFETSIAFSADHLTIQGRGQAGGVIQSAQMSSRYSDRSFIFEARITSPSTPGAWMEFWAYPFIASGSDASELDVELVVAISGFETVHTVGLANHGATQSNVVIADSHFTTAFNEYTNAAFDFSSGTHYYTIFYDDTGPGTIKRYIDGVLIFSATWKWMSSLGGTGTGPDANMTIDLAAGGTFPGNISSPATWTGDLDIYSLAIYSPRTPPVGQTWDQGHKSGAIQLSTDSLTATQTLLGGDNQAFYARISASSGKKYWEVLLTATSSVPAAGIGTTISSVFDNRYLGQDPNTLGWYATIGPLVNNSTAATWGTFSTTTAARLCFALDLDNHKLWGRIGTAGNWNGDVIGNQNPATNTGGLALGVALQTNICPAADMAGTDAIIVGVFASGSWAGTPPSGFGAW